MSGTSSSSALAYGRTREGPQHDLRPAERRRRRTAPQRADNPGQAALRCFPNLTADDLDLTALRPAGVAGPEKIPSSLPSTAAPSRRKPAAAPASRRLRRPCTGPSRRAGYQLRPRRWAPGLSHRLGVGRPGPARAATCWASSATGPRTTPPARPATATALRQQVLEGVGWRLHRIWSTDWFHDNARQQQKLIAYLTACRTEAPNAQPTRSEPDIYELPVLVAGSLPTTDVLSSLPYYYVTLARRNAQVELHEVGARRLIHIMLEILQYESPVHIDYLMKRVADAFGVGRIGDRIRSHFMYVFNDGNRSGQFVLDGDFV